jgi:hypothetical protein
MGKYYCWSGKKKLITCEKYPVTAAAVLAASFNWKGLGKSVKVSEVGFDEHSGHPDHEKDSTFTISFLKGLIGSG